MPPPSAKFPLDGQYKGICQYFTLNILKGTSFLKICSTGVSAIRKILVSRNETENVSFVKEIKCLAIKVFVHVHRKILVNIFLCSAAS